MLTQGKDTKTQNVQWFIRTKSGILIIHKEKFSRKLSISFINKSRIGKPIQFIVKRKLS